MITIYIDRVHRARLARIGAKGVINRLTCLEFILYLGVTLG